MVADGFTATDVPVTAPTPALMARVGEPVTVQLRVLDCPLVTFAGKALKLVMVGRPPAMTVTEAVVDPEALVAFRV